MAKQEFLKYFRVARSLFAHQRVHGASPVIDTNATESFIDRADIWLTPKAVQGFDVSDFSELGRGRQNELQTAVRDFLIVAERVPPRQPATLEQVRQARSAFAKI